MRNIIFLILILPIVSFAQIKISGKVLDASTKQPIAYVNIENFRLQTGTQSNQDGLFELNLPKGEATDTLKISCVGYLNKMVTNLQAIDNISYELVPTVFQLNEVKVSNKKPTEVEVGVLKKNGSKSSTHSFQIPGTQSAVYLKNGNYGIAYLKQLHFFMGDEMFEAPFRVHIFENNDGIPGKDLINKSIEFIAGKKNAWNIFNVAEYNLLMPANGLWISVEWIANDKYKKVINTTVTYPDGSKKPWSYIYYGPEIVANFDTNLGVTYRKWNGGKWANKTGQKRGLLDKNWRDAYTDLMIKATLEVYQ